MLMNQTDGITHTMLVHHIVERAVSTTFDHFGDVFRIGAETCHEVVDGDVLLRKDMFLGKSVVQPSCKVLESVVT